MAKAKYSKPASQLDLEARLKNDNKSDRVLSTAEVAEAPKDDGNARDFRVEGNDTSGYIGTDPVYQTYANETDAPLVGEKNPEETVAEDFVERLAKAQPSLVDDREPKERVSEPDEEEAGDPDPSASSTPQS